MATTSPARIDDDLYASAKLAGDVQSRSASQQVAHWARIGREIEASASISHKEIAEVLEGSRSYDKLSAKDQAVVRAEWSTRMEALREGLDLAREFEAVGRTWVELGGDGTVVEVGKATRRRSATERGPDVKSQGRTRGAAAARGRKVSTTAASTAAPKRARTGKAGTAATKQRKASDRGAEGRATG